MDNPVTAAARVVYEAGRRHRWSGFETPYDQLDAVSRLTFDGIIERALAAADAARAREPSDEA
jgi:hypothetical protein